MSEKERRRDFTKRRPTMKDVAEIADVHQTTVSLALRGHPGVSAGTRERVRAAAAALGYQRDPFLDAFNEHRTRVRQKRDKPIIGCIVDESFLSTSPADSYAQRRLNGIRSAAFEMGLQIESFILGKEGLSPSRLDGIMYARHIEGVIVAGLAYEANDLSLNWDRYAAVCIQAHQLGLRLDTVSTDLRQVVRLAVHRLRDLGYRRVGLTAALEDEDWLARSMTSGYLAESLALPVEDRIAPFLFAADVGPVGNRSLLKWVRDNEVEVVISNWNNVPQALEAGGFSIPAKIAFASIDLLPTSRGIAGVIESHEQVGRTAVEHLAILMHSHTRGLMKVPSIIYVPGSWRDGTTAPGLARSHIL